LIGDVGAGQYATTGVLELNTTHRVSDINDGASNTFLVGEMSWMSAPDSSALGQMLASYWARSTSGMSEAGGSYCCRNIRYPLAQEALKPGNWNDVSFGSMHADGANFLFADGTVKFKKNSTELTILQAHATRNGREPILDP
jgi:prepilin-type processing-associated H-X9-DG protein